MLLNNCELTPAVVQYVDDPKKLGRIKCVIPGIIDNNTMSKDNMPWCYPFCMSRYQSFSKCIPGQKVWILINKSNYNEYWYLPFFEYNKITKEYLEGVYDNDNPEVFMSRCLGENNAISTYDDKAGFSERIGDHHIDLHPDGHISIVGGDGQVDVDGGIVTLGNKTKDAEAAVKGDTLVKIMDNIRKKLSEGAASQPPGQPVSPTLQKALIDITLELAKANTILANYVKVN